MSGEVRASKGSRLYALGCLALIGAGAAFARTTLSPLQEAIRAGLTLTDNQMALLQGPALALPMLLTAAPIGLWTDRQSRARILWVLAFAAAAGCYLTAAAPGFGALFAARALVGLAAFGINPVIFSMLSDLFPLAARGRATMVIAIGQYGGIAGAFALGGVLLAGAGLDADGWRWAMRMLSVALLICVIPALSLREPIRLDASPRRPTIRESFGDFWRYRNRIVHILAGLASIEIVLGAILAWAAPILTRQAGLRPEQIGAILGGVFILGGCAGPMVGGLLADYCQRSAGPARTLIVLAALSLASAASGLFVYMGARVAITLLLGLAAIVSGAIVVMATTLFTIVIPNQLRGLCMSIAAAVCVLFGTGVAPVLVSAVASMLGGSSRLGDALVGVCAAAGLIAAANYIRCARAIGLWPDPSKEVARSAAAP